jgi:hypothetical protein
MLSVQKPEKILSVSKAITNQWKKHVQAIILESRGLFIISGKKENVIEVWM